MLFLAFVVCNSALSKDKFLLLAININREYMYWAEKGNIFRSLKNSLQSIRPNAGPTQPYIQRVPGLILWR